METNTETSNFYAHPELLLVADTVAREKGIDREEILDAIEEAIQKAGRSKYGYEHDIRAKIDRKSGEIHLARFLEVAEIVENEATQIPVDAARNKKEDAGNDDKNTAGANPKATMDNAKSKGDDKKKMKRKKLLVA